MSLHPDEEATVRAFIDKGRRHRWLWALATPRRRGTVLDFLNHRPDLDLRWALAVPDWMASPEAIARALRERGAPDICHVIGADELDGMDLPLDEVLAEVVEGRVGTLVCCIPGRLAYYESEEQHRRYVLERDAPSA